MYNPFKKKQITFGEIQARIASLLDCSIDDIILKFDPREASIRFDQKMQKFILKYPDLPALIHEFGHACFTNFDRKGVTETINCLEDYRMEHKLNVYDKRLSGFLWNSRNLKGLRKMEHDDSVLALVCINDLKFNELTKLLKVVPKKEVEEISRIKKAMLDNLDDYATFEQCVYDINKLLKSPPSSDETEQALETVAESSLAEQIKKNIVESSRQTIDELDEINKSRLIESLKRLTKAKELGRRMNTINGKLNSKRLGRLPSQYLFTKKTSPSPDTALWVLVDLSGSMIGPKLATVVKIYNTLLGLKISHLKINIRGFNTLYFKEEKLGKNVDDVDYNNMNIYAANGESAASYNDDPHWLIEILNEMKNDRTPNKKLMILSDGQPAPSGLYKERDLKKIAKTISYPYVSIGILTDAVAQYYKNYRILEDINRLPDLIRQEAVRMFLDRPK